MSGTERDEVLQHVAAAFRAGPDMVHVDEVGVGAARDLATVLVACEHGPAQGGGNGSSSAAHVGHVGHAGRVGRVRWVIGARWRSRGLTRGRRAVFVRGVDARNPEPFPVAGSHGHDLGIDGNELSARNLRALAAG